VPPGHSEQALALAASLNLPAAQLLHALAAAFENVPAVQAAHMVAPSVLLCLPGEHASHMAAEVPPGVDEA